MKKIHSIFFQEKKWYYKENLIIHSHWWYCNISNCLREISILWKHHRKNTSHYPTSISINNIHFHTSSSRSHSIQISFQSQIKICKNIKKMGRTSTILFTLGRRTLHYLFVTNHRKYPSYSFSQLLFVRTSHLGCLHSREVTLLLWITINLRIRHEYHIRGSGVCKKFVWERFDIFRVHKMETFWIDILKTYQLEYLLKIWTNRNILICILFYENLNWNYLHHQNFVSQFTQSWIWKFSVTKSK